MSNEVPVIEQPQSGTWLTPKERIGHLIACYQVTEKVMVYDKLAEKDKERAAFTCVDLDGEQLEMLYLDNHPGIVNKLKIGNPAIVLGRIISVPTDRKDALVLGEHGPGDAARLQQWWTGGKRPLPRAPSVPAPVHNLGNAQEVPAPAPVTVTPATVPAAVAPAVNLADLDPATIALMMKQLAQVQGQ